MHARAGCGTRGTARVRPARSPTPPGPARLNPRPRPRRSPAGKRLAKMVSTKQIMMATATEAGRRLEGAGLVFKGAAVRIPSFPAPWRGCLRGSGEAGG